MTTHIKALAGEVKLLRSLAEKNARFSWNRQDSNIHLFPVCVRAAFVKAYEFAELALNQNNGNSFFLVPSIRAITEELIILNFLSSLSGEDREFVIRFFIQFENAQSIRRQSIFFRKIRPFQPVLHDSSIFAVSKEMENKLCRIWRKNGWPKYKKRHTIGFPPIREIAQKSGVEILDVIYDYIYRLSSGAVHFQPRTLFRLGWRSAESEYFFSSTRAPINSYFEDVCQVYGCFLFCLYIELFENLIEPCEKEVVTLKRLRRVLVKKPRWPEMITPEEMNIPISDPPQIAQLVHAFFAAVMDEGFLAGSKLLLCQANAKLRDEGASRL